MPARVPLDVDMEDKLLYGLTPMRLTYLLVGLVAGFGAWSSQWAPTLVRGLVAVIAVSAGAIAAWGRWRGRAADDWAIDIFMFVAKNHRVRWGWHFVLPVWLSRRRAGADGLFDTTDSTLDREAVAEAA